MDAKKAFATVGLTKLCSKKKREKNTHTERGRRVFKKIKKAADKRHSSVSDASLHNRCSGTTAALSEQGGIATPGSYGRRVPADDGCHTYTYHNKQPADRRQTRGSKA